MRDVLLGLEDQPAKAVGELIDPQYAKAVITK